MPKERSLPLKFNTGSKKPCAVCGCIDADIRYYRFRRVTGAIIYARAVDEWGFLCRKCAVQLYGKSQVHNLLLGWWGLVGLVYHNPASIVGNTIMLFREPGKLTRRDRDYIIEYARTAGKKNR